MTPIHIDYPTDALRCTVVVLDREGTHDCGRLAAVLRPTASSRYQPMCAHHARWIVEDIIEEEPEWMPTT